MNAASTTKLHHKLVAVTAERDRLATELQKLREQKPVVYWEGFPCFTGSPKGELTASFQKCDVYKYPLYGYPVAAPAVALEVWFGSMPESNGKTNWTAILHRGDITQGITIDRSEYKDRVRYEADRMRWMIGELEERPRMLDYDADMHSGYKAPAVPASSVPTDEQIHAAYRVALGQSIRERDMPEIRKFAIALLQSAGGAK